MRTNIEKIAVLSKYQCCFAEMAGEVATKLGKGKSCNLVNELRNMKLARAYLNRICSYYTLTNPTITSNSIVIKVTGTGIGSVIINVDGTYYTFNGTLSTANIYTYFDTNLTPLGITITNVSSTKVTIAHTSNKVITVNLSSNIITDAITIVTVYDTDTLVIVIPKGVRLVSK